MIKEKAAELAMTPLNGVLDAAVRVGRPALLSHIRQLQQGRAAARPAEIIELLEKRYIATVATSGGLVGGSAAVPGVGAVSALGLGVADAAFFTTATAGYLLSLAEIHGYPVTDLERRRALLLGVVLGDFGRRTVTDAAGSTGDNWAGSLLGNVPGRTLRRINGILGRNFIRRYVARQGALIFGKAAPFGIGAVIGVSANAAIARGVVNSAHDAFGPPPQEWPTHLHPGIVPSSVDVQALQ